MNTLANSVTLLDNTFHAKSIIRCLPHINELQIAITHSEGNPNWTDGVGSLYNSKLHMIDKWTNDYTVLNKYFVGTYLEQVVNEVNYVAATDGVKIGRIRLLTLEQKTCYSLHRDFEEFRYHIPLITNDKCFFVNNNIVEFMPEVGRLYRFKTKDLHTAVNASFEKRVHLVFDTY
jgi:hypothetical protein